jgi:hypothetical protein
MTAPGHGHPGDGPPLRALAGGDAHGSHGVSSTADEGWWRRLTPGTSGDKRLEKASRKDAPMTKKNALLVYPEFATSFWSFKFTLQYLGKKSSMPPLGLLTLANLFPEDYNVRLVDMNVRPLTDADLQWADLVCT